MNKRVSAGARVWLGRQLQDKMLPGMRVLQAFMQLAQGGNSFLEPMTLLFTRFDSDLYVCPLAWLLA